jgi:hypothetical protein
MFKEHCSFYSTEVQLEILGLSHGVFVVFALLKRYQTANGVGIVICGRIGDDRFVKDYEEKNYNM